MKAVEAPPRNVTQSENDQRMLVWLREKMSHFKEEGYGRRYADSVIARFDELIDNHTTLKRTLGSVEDAHKILLAQAQFAQSVVHGLQRQVAALPQIENGHDKPTPAVELKGK